MTPIVTPFQGRRAQKSTNPRRQPQLPILPLLDFFIAYFTYCLPLFWLTTTTTYSPSCGQAFPTIYQSYITADRQETRHASVDLQPPFKSLSLPTCPSSSAPLPLNFVVVCHAYRISPPTHCRRSGMMSGPTFGPPTRTWVMD